MPPLCSPETWMSQSIIDRFILLLPLPVTSSSSLMVSIALIPFVSSHPLSNVLVLLPNSELFAFLLGNFFV
ncbi:MAG: hypothetical protein K0Q59_5713 [Paenibacillus sp.]|nr:hypothetical protein [Paenibacillus sp.]